MFSSDTESRVFNWGLRGSNKKQRRWTPAQQTAGVTIEETVGVMGDGRSAIQMRHRRVGTFAPSRRAEGV